MKRLKSDEERLTDAVEDYIASESETDELKRKRKRDTAIVTIVSILVTAGTLVYPLYKIAFDGGLSSMVDDIISLYNASTGSNIILIGEEPVYMYGVQSIKGNPFGSNEP